jgi:hypothetical protein
LIAAVGSLPGDPAVAGRLARLLATVARLARVEGSAQELEELAESSLSVHDRGLSQPGSTTGFDSPPFR